MDPVAPRRECWSLPDEADAMVIDQTSTPEVASQTSSAPSDPLGPVSNGPSSPSSKDGNVQEWLTARAQGLEDGPLASHAPGHHSCLDRTDPTRQTDEMDQSMNLRSYQREMFERSLGRNVIVTMDTGTGKTRVAIRRIQFELERCDEDKIVWFLAPKVALCAQQYEAIKALMPAIWTTLLTGTENNGTWRKDIWQAVLASSQIIVSTPDVLRDALCHAFLSLDRLALLVIDEAHNAAKNSSPRRIMLDFYHPRKSRGLAVPSILGLTASPSMRSTGAQLIELEETLDALCIAPTVHRDELLRHANRPQIRLVVHELADAVISTKSMEALRAIYRKLDIRTDPYVLKLKADATERNQRRLEKAILERKTWSQSQFRGLLDRAEVLLEELGAWAADHYIWDRVSGLINRVQTANSILDEAWLDAEKVYVTEKLISRSWDKPLEQAEGRGALSGKVRNLIEVLLAAKDPTVGIVFVKDRVVVAMLKEVLLAHASIREKYRIGTQVGSNMCTGKTRDLFETKDLNNSLPDFISGKVNLMIATNVLEEGIDVPACNLVICFDAPANAKSFIQQRGRARKSKSELVMFFDDSRKSHLAWEAAEAEMRCLYESEARERIETQRVENSESPGNEAYVVPETGARLDYENAKSHLQHFCAALSRRDLVDTSPDYITHADPRTGLLTAEVILPSAVASHLRRTSSNRPWRSEKNATKDAAFQAYKALHLAGWLDDHLLPLRSRGVQGVETREAIVEAHQLLRPWNATAKLWQSTAERWIYPILHLDGNGATIGEYNVVLPIEMKPPRPIQVYLDGHKTQHLQIGSPVAISEQESAQLPDHTSALLGSHFDYRWRVEDQAHVVQIFAKDADFTNGHVGALSFADGRKLAETHGHLVRGPDGCPYIYEGIIPSKPEMEDIQSPFRGLEAAPDDVPYLSLRKWTKRSDFLHPLTSVEGTVKKSDKPYHTVLPMNWAKVDASPSRYAEFGMLIPSLIHELEVMLLVHFLDATLLNDVRISDKELIREAISARGSSEPYHYEKLEFLGDSILKFCASVQLAADHTEWPEGYLSFAKDKLVANSRLSRACVETKLAEYILTKSFTGQKWRPLYLVDALTAPRDSLRRFMSTKTLADVVEALIGASFADGGLPKALKCISLFLSEVNWRETSNGRDVILKAARVDNRKVSLIAPVQELIGYTFKTPSLLWEALTHASYAGDSEASSLERLEFLGDAVLDYIIVTKLYEAKPSLNHGQMHMLKTALVNGDFLAFIALELKHESVRDVATFEGDLEQERIEKALWMFMRHTSSSVVEEQKMTAQRHMKMRDEALEAIDHGTHYPWPLFARLQAKKFYSDLIEALIGAVWIDSGSMDQCEAMLTRLGILPYMERMLRDNVHVQHPKEELTKAAGSEKITYALDVREREDGEKEWLCKILLGERVIADVVDGVNKEEVKTKAAAEALAFLNRERGVQV